MRDYLDKAKPVMYIALINSSWNPLSNKALEDLAILKWDYPDALMVVGNEDEDTRFEKYFDIKATP